MRKTSLFLIFAQLIFFSTLANSEIAVYFSPKGECEKTIIDTIDVAKVSINAAVYYFTEREIANALVRAKDRGVKIKVVLDKSQKSETYSKFTYLSNNGVPVYINSHYAIMHNKYAVIDGETVITGSFNWTAAAENENAENLLIIKDGKIAQSYQTNFDKLFKESLLAASEEKSEKDITSKEEITDKKSTNDTTVYITKTGSKYHSSGCSYLRKSSIPISLKDAKGRGLTPCSKCNPPE